MHPSQTIKSLRASPPSEIQGFLINFGLCPGRKTPEVRKCQRADSLSHMQREEITQAVLSHLASCRQAPQASQADLTPHCPPRRASVSVSVFLHPENVWSSSGPGGAPTLTCLLNQALTALHLTLASVSNLDTWITSLHSLCVLQSGSSE